MYWTTHRLLLVGLLLAAGSPSALADAARDQYLVAATHYRLERWELARAEFAEFVRRYPDHDEAATAQFLMGESLVQLGQIDEARAEFQRFLESYAEHRFRPQAAFRLGETAYLLGQAPEAREQLERFVEQYADHALNAFALVYLGQLALVEARLDDAESHFSDGLRRYPRGPLAAESRYGLGRAAERRGDWSTATRFYRVLVDSASGPDDSADRSLAADAQLRIARLQYQREQYAEAIGTLEELRERFPDSPLRVDAHYWTGLAYTALEQWAEAATSLEEAAAADAQSRLAPAIEFAWAQALHRQGRAEAARTRYERVWTEWPDSAWGDNSLQAAVQLAWERDAWREVVEQSDAFDGLFRDSPLRPAVAQLRGRALLRLARWQEAIDVFQELEATADGPSDVDAGLGPAVDVATRYYRALGLLGLERYEEALEVLDQLAVARSPRDSLAAAVAAGRGAALVGLGRYREAIGPLRDHIDQAPEGPEVIRSRAHLVVALTEQGQLRAAQRALEALWDATDDVELVYGTAGYLADRAVVAGDQRLARQLFGYLADQQRDPAQRRRGLEGLAQLAIDEGDDAEAAGVLERLVASGSADPSAYWQLAETLARLGDERAAQEQFERLMTQHPESEAAQAARLEAARQHNRSGRHLQAAQLLEPALDQPPGRADRPAMLYELAWTLVYLERPDEADAVFARLCDEHPTSRYAADASYRLAERATRAADYRAAEARLARLVDGAYDEPVDRSLLGHALYLQGQLAAAESRWDEAARALGRLLEAVPDSGLALPAQYWLAEAEFRRDRFDAAAELLDELHGSPEAAGQPWHVMVKLRRAQIHAHRQQWAEALELAELIVERYPDFPQQYELDYLVGRAQAARADFDAARAAYQQVLASPTGGRSETAAMAQWMIGETYFLQGRHDEAIRAYHRVEALFAFPQWQALALLQAAKCHEHQRRWSEAVRLYQQLIEQYPQSLPADEALQRLAAAEREARLAQSTTAPSRN